MEIEEHLEELDIDLKTLQDQLTLMRQYLQEVIELVLESRERN
tara:strand:+ start:209 stop:337 length:129 start_codon:yes stop_codon:yes gene_type:complete